ncbi:MAG: hypothetical protein PHT37_08960, partial [Candidatus Cloacimonetes bacterium]|nr:hypothetical protein [Candidatus Cloacimonadota bacterium]
MIVDDGSTDGTHEYLTSNYEKEFAIGRLRYYGLSKNMGPS